MSAHLDMDALTDAIRREPRLAAVVLFGSGARGALRPDSDLDLGVLPASSEARESMDRDLLGVLGRLGQAAGRVVHLVDLERADPELRRGIFRDGKILLDRSEGRLPSLRAKTLIEYFDWAYARQIIDAAHSRRLAQRRG